MLFIDTPLGSEVTLLRRELGQTTAQEQEQALLQALAQASQSQIAEYESNALMIPLLLGDPDALAHGTFTQHDGRSIYEGTSAAGLHFIRMRTGPH